MDSMILGRYVSGNSIIHRLDPRSKLLSMFLFILIIFLANNIVTNGLLFVFTMLLVGLSKIPLGFFLKGLRSMVFLIAFTTYSNYFLHLVARLYFNLALLELLK